MDGWMDGWMGGWMDGWMHACMHAWTPNRDGRQWLPLHVLDLHSKGIIYPHVDSPKFSGDIVAGLSLYSDSMCTFDLHHADTDDDGDYCDGTSKAREASHPERGSGRLLHEYDDAENSGIGGSGSGGGFVPISLDEPVVQSRADELHAQRVELDDAAAARAAALSHEDDDEAKHHHHLPSFVVGRRSPQSSSSDRLADVLSGQPIPIGATSDIFAEAFDVDASAHAQQLGVRTCVSLHTLCSVRSVG